MGVEPLIGESYEPEFPSKEVVKTLEPSIRGFGGPLQGVTSPSAEAGCHGD